MIINVVKFNNILYERGDVVVITKKDGTVVVGSITIPYDENMYCSTLKLDISEKYQSKILELLFTDILSIQKVS